jgi:hypothetical protein
MQVLDREAAIAAWRRAESRIYPSVMLNAELYQQYIGLVRAIAALLEDVHTEDELVVAWTERRELVREAVSESAPPMLGLMDHEAVRDAAFCHRHREITREMGKVLARERLERARREQAAWVVLFEDVTPLGSHRLEAVQLDPRDGAWLLDKPPLMPARTFDTREEWEARIEQARATLGRD